MIRIAVITSEEDAEAFEFDLRKEMGKTEKEWFLETDPDDPPLESGDMVWIESMDGGVPNELIPALRQPQEVECVTPIPCSDKPLWDVKLMGIAYSFTQYDVRKA